jgi:ribokinase
MPSPGRADRDAIAGEDEAERRGAERTATGRFRKRSIGKERGMTVDLLVAGSLNLDLVARVTRLPAAGETVGGAVLTRQAGGKGANQAAAASRLGANVRIVGAVGADAEGSLLREALADAGVDTSLVTTAGAPTGSALVLVDADGENAIVVAPGANELIDVAAVPIPPDATVLVQLEIPMPAVLDLARRTRGTFVVNAAPAAALPSELVEAVDLFIVNESEYAQLPELRAARLVAMTLGSRGAVLLEKGTEIARSPGRAVAVESTVGAGDAFCAALVVGLADGLDPAEALGRACAVGAAAVADPRSQPHLERLSSYPASW